MASRVAWASIAVSIFLKLVNLAIAVAAGMVHNLLDLVASVAVLAGYTISEWESRAFPHGPHKVENVVLLRHAGRVHGKSPAYVLADADMEARMTQADTVATPFRGRLYDLAHPGSLPSSE